jgi:chromosome segregation ATPase
VWSDAKQQQLNDFRRRAASHGLSPEEQQSLDRLLHDLDEQELALLTPTLTRLHQERVANQAELDRLAQDNATLAALADRFGSLLDRARAQLTSLTSERDALRSEYERMLHPASGH